MKKLTKLLSKVKRTKADDESPARITNETVAAHREKILAGGRRFKYPVQVAKHRLAIISIAIGVLAIFLLAVLAWYQLYVAQNTSKLMYRVTEILPVSVADVDGQSVRYSEYLKKYRSSIYYLQQQNNINLSSPDGQRQSNHIKGQELNSAELDAYAMKVAAGRHISVSSKEVDDFINKDIQKKHISLDAYEKTVLQSFYDWSLDDYRAVVKTELLKRKVRFAVDTTAQNKANSVLAQLRSGSDFAAVATAQSDDDATKANGGQAGTVSTDNEDGDGVIAAAAALQPGQISPLISGTDGYYIVKLGAKTSNSVTYSFIKINVTAFDANFAKLQKSGKIKEFITVKRD